MRISDWSSDVCSSDLARGGRGLDAAAHHLIEVGRVALLAPLRGHTAVPPTVIPLILTWPWPVPTGAVWPDLPQNPVFISKSDRKRVVSGKSVAVRVALGGRRITKKKTNT